MTALQAAAALVSGEFTDVSCPSLLPCHARGSRADKNGDVVSELNNYAFRGRVYNASGSIRVVDVGADRIAYNPDGSISQRSSAMSDRSSCRVRDGSTPMWVRGSCLSSSQMIRWQSRPWTWSARPDNTTTSRQRSSARRSRRRTCCVRGQARPGPAASAVLAAVAWTYSQPNQVRISSGRAVDRFRAHRQRKRECPGPGGEPAQRERPAAHRGRSRYRSVPSGLCSARWSAPGS